MQKELEYLGILVTYLHLQIKGGVKPQQKKVEVTERIKTPTNSKKNEAILRNGQFLQRRVEKLFIHSRTFEQTIIQNRQTELEMGKRATNKKTLNMPKKC